jgi:ABC-2 type transport system ATP-binding protein
MTSASSDSFDGRERAGSGDRSGAGPGEVILRTLNLSKRFGQIVAVDGLDLEVRAGEVLGFLGPNGSGKSTTVGMILDLIAPTSGHVELFGKPLAEQAEARVRHVGAIVETPAFYPYLSGRDNLRALARAVGGVPDTRVDDLLAQVGLAERAKGKFKTYSLGMKQRLGIASTLLTDPALVILDEPTNGLDPAGQREIRAMIPELARQGRGVLLASHLLYEVEQVCDRVAIIRRGRLVESGRIADLVRREAILGIVLPPTELERGAAVLRALPFVAGVTAADGALVVDVPEERGADVNRALAGQGLFAAAIVPRRSSLEDVFLDLTEGSTPGEQALPSTPDGRDRDAAPVA